MVRHGWGARARRRLVVGGPLGVLGSLVVAGPAAAAVIPGDPLRIFGDGQGHLQARFQGTGVGELRPSYLDLADQRSGMVFTTYGSGGSPSSVCGPSPAGSPPTPVSGPVVSGAGSLASPYEMTTSYVCGSGSGSGGGGGGGGGGGDGAFPLDVTQTFTYVNGATVFDASYAISNPGTQAVKFSAVNRGVFAMAGSGLGAGFLDAAAPRTIGVRNDAQGSAAGFVEAADTPWTHYTEGPLPLPPATIDEPAESELFGGLDDTVDGSLAQDPRAAVQFDRYTSVGLAGGASDTFDVSWYFTHYDGLALVATGPFGLQTGQTRSVTATSSNFGQPVGGATIRYAIAGANQTSGTVRTAPDGTATISWIGSQAGQDTLTAYVDTDNDGVFDPLLDTRQTAVFAWTAPPPVTPPPSSTVAPSLKAPPGTPPAFAPIRPMPGPLSNEFIVLGRRTAAGGIVFLTLRGHAPGTYRAVATAGSGRRAYGRGTVSPSHGGRVTLVIRPTPAARHGLAGRGLLIAVVVTFKPTGGTPRTRRVTVSVAA